MVDSHLWYFPGTVEWVDSVNIFTDVWNEHREEKRIGVKNDELYKNENFILVAEINFVVPTRLSILRKEESYSVLYLLKDNRMGSIKIHNGGNYAHAQDSDAYNFSYR